MKSLKDTLIEKKAKKIHKLIIKVAKLVIRKLIKLLPHLIGAFFGIEDDDGYGSYGYGSYGYGSDGYRSVEAKNSGGFAHGILGIIPAIIFKLIAKVSKVVKILQKNTFLKHFFIPAALILVVNGALIFLVWWLYPQNSISFIEKPIDTFSQIDHPVNSEYEIIPYSYPSSYY